MVIIPHRVTISIIHTREKSHKGFMHYIFRKSKHAPTGGLAELLFLREGETGLSAACAPSTTACTWSRSGGRSRPASRARYHRRRATGHRCCPWPKDPERRKAPRSTSVTGARMSDCRAGWREQARGTHSGQSTERRGETTCRSTNVRRELAGGMFWSAAGLDHEEMKEDLRIQAWWRKEWR